MMMLGIDHGEWSSHGNVDSPGSRAKSTAAQSRTVPALCERHAACSVVSQARHPTSACSLARERVPAQQSRTTQRRAQHSRAEHSLVTVCQCWQSRAPRPLAAGTCGAPDPLPRQCARVRTKAKARAGQTCLSRSCRSLCTARHMSTHARAAPGTPAKAAPLGIRDDDDDEAGTPSLVATGRGRARDAI